MFYTVDLLNSNYFIYNHYSVRKKIVTDEQRIEFRFVYITKLGVYQLS